jgi:hypothetical protein
MSEEKNFGERMKEAREVKKAEMSSTEPVEAKSDLPEEFNVRNHNGIPGQDPNVPKARPEAWKIGIPAQVIEMVKFAPGWTGVTFANTPGEQAAIEKRGYRIVRADGTTSDGYKVVLNAAIFPPDRFMREFLSLGGDLLAVQTLEEAEIRLKQEIAAHEAMLAVRPSKYDPMRPPAAGTGLSEGEFKLERGVPDEKAAEIQRKMAAQNRK